MRYLPLAVLALVAVACASATPIPDADRARLESSLTGQTRYLRVSLYQGPFWSDDSKTFLSAAPMSEVALFTDPHGADVPAPAATGILPAGRRVHIDKVELPTGLVVTGRLPYTPRYNPWVYLTVDGDSSGKPAIIVLRSDIKSREQFEAALDGLLTQEDPGPRLSAYSDDVRKAIAEKQVTREMDAEAVQMAWGPPEHKSIDLKGNTRTEVWTYSKGRRTVALSDGKVTRAETSATPTAQPASTTP